MTYSHMKISPRIQRIKNERERDFASCVFQTCQACGIAQIEKKVAPRNPKRLIIIFQ
jgi:hypothetical protein